jgi:lipopolysaccharide transport system ATP-binding protein
MSSVIQISNISKIYRLGEIGTGTISRDLERWYKMKVRGQEDPFLKIGQTNKTSEKGVSDIVYSLRDINLEVKQGEALGIIGKNGAGKSTLLKILSRVTSPTTGKINIKGRVASLLEVGTGFHPELTGRENIYLNGAILGMRKYEITRKLDEIIDFSGVERYIDTPVKRYSSGMYVRLAFAVAAHLESEILIVDEVLAVGDAEFQEKCLGKMGDIRKGDGRTILFVSHNMGAIRSLCNRAALLFNGQIIADSKTDLVVSQYFNRTMLEKAMVKEEEIEAQMEGVILRKNPHVRFIEIAMLDQKGELSRSFFSNESIFIRIRFRALKTVHNLFINVELVDENDNVLLLSMNTDDDVVMKYHTRHDEGIYEYICEIPPNLLGSKTFFISVQLECPKVEHLIISKILGFDVVFAGFNNNHLDAAVFFRPQLKWNMQRIN